MNCSCPDIIRDLPIGCGEPLQSMNKKLLLDLDHLTKDARKAMKLLVKQYQVRSVEVDDPITDGKEPIPNVIRPGQLIMIYSPWNDPGTEFVWTFNRKDFKQ